MKTNEAYAQWKCPDCGWTTLFSYQDIVEIGNPICKCDTEMELYTDDIHISANVLKRLQGI